MKFAAALTTKTDWTEAVEDLIRQIQPQLGTGQADLAFLFVHPQYRDVAGDLVRLIHETLGSRHLIGCTGAGIIGQDSEVEKNAAVSLLAAQLPDVTIKPFAVTVADLQESTDPAFWHFQLETEPQEDLSLVLLADPFTIPAIQLVDTFNAAYRGVPLAGGLASGAQQQGENRLFLDGKVLEEGAVGLALTGKVALHTIVSQGCRPIGEPFVITRADKNVLFELGGKPPILVLQEMLPQLPQRDQQLARTALFIGRVINEYQEEFGRGDFLIRNLIGSDPQSGALAVGDLLRTGQTVQFHVRDGLTADEDLRHMLATEKKKALTSIPQGGLLFSCLGRGQGMYGSPHHDIKLIHQFLGAIPTAGFFCNGEIGPVGQKTFVHGFTSVVALFAEPQS